MRAPQSGIRFIASPIHADVSLDESGMEATWKPLSPLPEGEHLLLIEDVTSSNGEKTVAPWELHFTVAANEHPGSPHGQILLHRSMTKLRMSEKQYLVSKLMDPESGRRYEVATDD